MTIVKFDVSLSQEDWDFRLGGWRCNALLIPGAKVEAVYHDGNKADTKNYSDEDSVIRWSTSPVPDKVLVRISLTKDLNEIEERKLELEQDKLNLDKRWRAITAVITIVMSLLTSAVAYKVGVSKQTSLNSSAASNSLSTTNETQAPTQPSSPSVANRTTGNVPIPAPTSKRLSPTEFVEDYYNSFNENPKQIDKAWGMLTRDFQNSSVTGGYDSFFDWWSRIVRVQILESELVRQSNDKNMAKVRVQIAYWEGNHRRNEESLLLTLFWNDREDKWQINDSKKFPM
jgi:hypothetical protein